MKAIDFYNIIAPLENSLKHLTEPSWSNNINWHTGSKAVYFVMNTLSHSSHACNDPKIICKNNCPKQKRFISYYDESRKEPKLWKNMSQNTPLPSRISLNRNTTKKSSLKDVGYTIRVSQGQFSKYIRFSVKKYRLCRV